MSAIVAGVIGYWLRFDAPVPDWLRDRSGGAVYVLFWALLAGAFVPRVAAWRLALAVFLATCGLEFAQRWHPAWLERIRATLPGRLVLGTTFDWSDFPPYAVGSVLAWAAIMVIHHQSPHHQSGE